MYRPPQSWLIALAALGTSTLHCSASDSFSLAQIVPEPSVAVSIVGAIAFLAMLRRRRA